MASDEEFVAGLVPGPVLATFLVRPEMSYGDNSLGFFFGNSTKDNLQVTVTALVVPPQCNVSVLIGEYETQRLYCELAKDHNGPHRAPCDGWDVSFQRFSTDG